MLLDHDEASRLETVNGLFTDMSLRGTCLLRHGGRYWLISLELVKKTPGKLGVQVLDPLEFHSRLLG